MLGLTIYSDVENICITASFQQEGRFGHIKLALLHNFYWSACIKPGKWEVIYFCIVNIYFASFYDFSIRFKNRSSVWYFLVCILLIELQIYDKRL